MNGPRPAAEHSGLLRFMAYAYPPNRLGYCGGTDHDGILGRIETGTVDGGLAALALDFEGPMPYLTLLSEKTGAGGPFSASVVEAYWLGNELLDRIDLRDFGTAMSDTLGRRSGWGAIASALPGSVPNHSFHVLVAGPWLGLLERTGRSEIVDVLDRCRIGW
ncbi:MAG: DUF6390 family protein, partial [Acidimicrobiia bacterium]|nr:DUF6390 family protein [Acidimicrobiia bacterium]